MEQVKTINHLGQVVYPQLYEWSNAYKAAVELTK